MDQNHKKKIDNTIWINEKTTALCKPWHQNILQVILSMDQ